MYMTHYNKSCSPRHSKTIYFTTLCHTASHQSPPLLSCRLPFPNPYQGIPALLSPFPSLWIPLCNNLLLRVTIKFLKFQRKQINSGRCDVVSEKPAWIDLNFRNQYSLLYTPWFHSSIGSYGKRLGSILAAWILQISSYLWIHYVF